MAKRLLLIIGLIACTGLNPFELAIGAEPLKNVVKNGVSEDIASSEAPVFYANSKPGAALSVVAFDFQERMNREGGLVFVLQLRKDKQISSLPSLFENRRWLASEVIRFKNRVISSGYPNADFSVLDENHLAIFLPGVAEAPELEALLSPQSSQLAFHLVIPDEGLAADAALPPEVTALKVAGKDEWIRVYSAPSLDIGKHLASADSSPDDFGGLKISLELDASGARTFAHITENNIGRRLALVLEDRILLAPTIQSKISDGKMIITGRFEPDEITDIALKIYSNSGASAPLSLLEKRVFAPAAGKGVGS